MANTLSGAPQNQADDDYSDFLPESAGADVAQVEGSDYSDFIPESSGAIRMASEWVPGEPRTHATQFGPDEWRPTRDTVERYGLPDIGQADSIKWLGAKGSEGDYSGFISDKQQSAGPDDYSGFKPASEVVAAPEPQKQGPNLWDQILDVWNLGRANAKTAIPAQAAKAPALPDQYDTEIQNVQASAYLSQEQKDQTVATLRGQQAQERANQAAQLPEAQQEQAKAQAQYEKDKPGLPGQLIGGFANYAPSALGGPLGPLMAAQQATSETYGQVLTESLQKARAAHPDWSEAEVMQRALETAQEAGRGAGGAMLALSWLDVPAAGPFLKRILQKAGSSALTMEIANTAAEIQRNMAIQKNIDPARQWWEGLNKIEFHLSNLAGGALYGGVHEATSIKPNTEEPGVTTVETPHVPGKITKTAPEPATIFSGHQTGPQYLPNIVAQQQAQTADSGEPGTRAAPFEENGEAVNIPQGEEPEPTSATTEPQTPRVEAPPGREVPSNGSVVSPAERGMAQAQPEQNAQVLPNWEDLSPEERASQTAQVKTAF